MNEVFLDTETTGLSFKDGHKVVEIACIETKDLIATGKVFHKFNPFFADGFRVDKDDNVWTSAGKGIKCFNPQGEVIGQLLLPDLVANLTFGGENNNILYVTCSSNLYSMELNQQGK